MLAAECEKHLGKIEHRFAGVGGDWIREASVFLAIGIPALA